MIAPEQTIVERKLTIAVEALRKIQDRGRAYECDYEDATAAFSQIAALDPPPQPDLAEIGAVAYRKAREADGAPIVGNPPKAALLAAYAAMRAADEADPMTGEQKPPPELDAIARKVLSYKPKPKTTAAKARKRRAKKAAQNA